MLNKKFLPVFALVIACFLILGTANINAQDSFTYWSMWEEGEPQQQVLANAIQDFEEEYGVEVDVRWTGRDVITALRPRFLAGENIDMTDQSGEELYGGLVAHDVAQPLNDVLEMQVPGEENTVEDILNEESYELYYTADGNLYMIPYNFISSAFWYNKTLFAELGIEAPVTWDEFLDMGDILKENNIEPVAFGLQTDSYQDYFPYLAAMRILGTNKLNEAAADETGEKFQDPRWVRVGEIIRDFTPEGEDLLMQGYESAEFPSPQMDLAMGIAGTFYAGSWIPVELSDAVDPDWEWGSFQFPTFEDGDGEQTAVESYPIGFSILDNADNADLAKEFIAFFLREEYANEWVEVSRNMTPRVGIEPPEELAEVAEALENAEESFRLWDGVQADYPSWYDQVYQPLTRAIYQNEITPEEYAERLSEETREFWE